MVPLRISSARHGGLNWRGQGDSPAIGSPNVRRRLDAGRDACGSDDRDSTVHSETTGMLPVRLASQIKRKREFLCAF